MRYILSFLLACVSCVAVQAQTPAPTPDPAPADHLFVSGSVIAFNGPNGMTASSQFGAALQLTHTVSAGYMQIGVPSLDRTYKMGAVNFSKPVSSYLGKKLSSKFVFDLSQVDLTIQGVGGKVYQVAPHPVFENVAAGGGVYLSIPLANHLSFTPVGVLYLHGGKNPSQITLLTGFNFHL